MKYKSCESERINRGNFTFLCFCESIFAVMFVTGNMCVSSVQVAETIREGRNAFCILKQEENVSSQRKGRGRVENVN